MNNSVSVALESGLSDLIDSYLIGQKSLLECAEWFSTIDWTDIDVTSKLAGTIGKLQLVCTEVIEGMRLESEFEQEASRAALDINRTSCIRFFFARAEGIIVSGSSTNNIQISTMPLVGLELQSLNISPEVVSA